MSGAAEEHEMKSENRWVAENVENKMGEKEAERQADSPLKEN